MSIEFNTLAPLSYGAALEIIDELPTAIRAVRRIRRLSQAQSAEEIGCGQATLGKIEAGGEYNTPTLRKILKWLDSQPETAMDKAVGIESSKHATGNNGNVHHSGGDHSSEFRDRVRHTRNYA